MKSPVALPRVLSRRAFLEVTAGAALAAPGIRLAGFRRTDGSAVDVYALVLGSIQDGGLPQAGCYSPRCERARTDPHYVASLALVEEGSGRVWLIDPSPDLIRQMDLIPGQAFRSRAGDRRPFEGIFLTHAHIGHYLGLALLGREGLGIAPTPCYCTRRMAQFLRANAPWNLLVEEGRLLIREMEPGRAERAADTLSVTAMPVPHRDEFSDTVAFVVRGPRAALLYLPDIDAWDSWEVRIEDVVAGVDVALIDGTFYSAAEVPGRHQGDVPHPLVPETMDRLESIVRGGTKVVFTHLNNTNPMLDPESPERTEAIRRGFGIARAGLRFSL